MRGMMDFLKGPWSYASMLILVAVVVAVAWMGVRRARGQRRAPERPLGPPMALDDPANLDSSHVGGPIFESTIDPTSRRK
jgi:hypothetical protein